MIRQLINLGLIATPFVAWKGLDLRTPKEYVALGVALIIGLVSFYKGSLKPFKNIWLLIFIGFTLISMWFAPEIEGLIYAYRQGDQITLLIGRPIGGGWMYKAILYVLIYTLLLISTASYCWTKEDIRWTLSIMVWCGFIMALYVFIQALHLDQFFHKVSVSVNPDMEGLDQPLLGGFIGHPTTVSPFMGMLIPIAFYLRKYLFGICMMIAVVMTESKVAMGGMVGGLIVCGFAFSMQISKILAIVIIVLLILGGIYICTQNTGVEIYNMIDSHANGRLAAWKSMWHDFTTPINGSRYTMTGWGPGAFQYRYSITHSDSTLGRWRQAHNEPFEVLLNFGIVGLGLLGMGAIHMVRGAKRHRITYFLFASLVCIFLCSLGTFSFQLAPTMFYTVIIIGLLHNENLGGEDAKT